MSQYPGTDERAVRPAFLDYECYPPIYVWVFKQRFPSDFPTRTLHATGAAHLNVPDRTKYRFGTSACLFV